MKLNSEVVDDTAEHVLFTNRKPHHILVSVVRVSLNPCQFVVHKKTCKDISTSSCSLYCKLSFKAKWCQSAEGAVNGWLLSAKKEHFNLFPVAPLWRRTKGYPAVHSGTERKAGCQYVQQTPAPITLTWGLKTKHKLSRQAKITIS